MGLIPVISICFILSGILDTQTKMSVSENGSHAIKIGHPEIAANSPSALFTHVRPLHRIDASCTQESKGLIFEMLYFYIYAW